MIAYHKFRKKPEHYLQKYEKGIVDSGVYQLKKHGEYQFLDEYPLKLPQKWEWVIPDYPQDMLEDWPAKKCISMTYKNISKFIVYPGSLISIQFEFMNWLGFQREYNHIYKKYGPIKKRFAIGNLCRLILNPKKTRFLINVLRYILNHNPENYSIHFFGLPLPGIRYLIQQRPFFPITIDNTKWTKAVNQKCRKLNLSCTGEDRQLYFDEYMKEIQRELKNTNNNEGLDKWM